MIFDLWIILLKIWIGVGLGSSFFMFFRFFVIFHVFLIFLWYRKYVTIMSHYEPNFSQISSWMVSESKFNHLIDFGPQYNKMRCFKHEFGGKKKFEKISFLRGATWKDPMVLLRLLAPKHCQISFSAHGIDQSDDN